MPRRRSRPCHRARSPRNSAERRPRRPPGPPTPAAPRRSDNQDLLDQIRKATGADPTKQIINETAHFGSGNTRKRPLEYVSLAERLRTGSQPVAKLPEQELD